MARYVPAGAVIKADIAREYHHQYPDAPTLTLARRMRREQPALFVDVEAARSALRYTRGNSGQHSRTHARPECFRPNGSQSDGFAAIPPGRRQLEEWSAFKVAGPAKVLVLADIHVPYHDAEAVRLALEDGQKWGATGILFNGDLTDHYALSKFDKDPRERDFKGEVETTKALLAAVRGIFPDARLWWKKGNHEERWEQYLKRSASDLFDIDTFAFGELYDLAQYGVELIGDKRPIALGKLNVIHGHEYTFAISNPVNPARGLFLRAKVHALCAHFHQSSQHSETDLKGDVISTWSTGALCDLHPEYRPINNWGLGYAKIEIDKAGAFQVDNLRIIDGRVY